MNLLVEIVPFEENRRQINMCEFVEVASIFPLSVLPIVRPGSTGKFGDFCQSRKSHPRDGYAVDGFTTYDLLFQKPSTLTGVNGRAGVTVDGKVTLRCCPPTKQ